MIHYKFALPLTCPILALIGLALGASNHRGGRLASFVFGFGVILVNYVLLYGARAVAHGRPAAAGSRGLGAEHRDERRRRSD